MFENINNDGILNNSSVMHAKSKIVHMPSSALKRVYSDRTDLLDQTEISDDAFTKYEQDQEIRKYKDIVLDMLNISETLSNSKAEEIKDLIEV